MSQSRRSFLRFVAGSPLLPLMGVAGYTDRTAVAAAQADALTSRLQEIIASPEDAVNVFDFEAAARRRLPPAHFGYMATGVDDDRMLVANREGFQKFYLRPRRLVDVSEVDMSVDLFGERWETPIVLAPCGSQRAFHHEGELAVARAARQTGHLQILSTVSSTTVADVAQARAAPVWQQLYPTERWTVTEGLLRKAEAAGCPVVVLTVDLHPGGNRETLTRAMRRDSRECSRCHEDSLDSLHGFLRSKPMFDGLDISDVQSLDTSHLTWDFVRRLRDATDMRVVVKGIVTREDAARCVEYGADAVVVSNHGARAEDSGLATIEALPEVLEAVNGRIPVLVDSGFRRGTDVFKAMALGASAVCIGRPYLWGLGAFGQPGVEKVLELLTEELRLAMQQAGTPSLRDVDATAIGRV